MRLDPLTRDYPAFIEELVAVLQVENTRYYLDTSLLMWLVRVGSAARTEFYRLVQQPASEIGAYTGMGRARTAQALGGWVYLQKRADHAKRDNR